VSGAGPGEAPDTGAIVVAESQRQIGIMFGFLILVFAVAVVRVVTGGQANTGGVVVAILFGIFLVALIPVWIVRSRRRARLEITEDAIRYMRRDGQVSTLSRQQGDELRFVKRHAAALSRTWTLGLTIVGTDDVITPLNLFSRDAVRQACRARGWHFDDRDQVIRRPTVSKDHR
jgi:hypothetical protein